MKLSKELKKAQFEKVYNFLENEGFLYNIGNISKIFPNCDIFQLYTFLMYAVSREETVDKHITICDCLIYLDPFISDAYNLIHWHIIRAIALQNADQAMLWTIEIFGSNPSSPFSDSELLSFAKCILVNDPHNESAKQYLRWSEQM